MVEQGTHKPLVVGSNPSLATYRHSSRPIRRVRAARSYNLAQPSRLD